VILNVDISKYMLPILGAACIGGAGLVVSGARTPAAIEAPDPDDAAEARMPKDLVLDHLIPTMEQVVAKHLFVPERVATGENAFPDLLVKGVYVGETERNAVFSLKSRPAANLRVWQGDEDAALEQVTDERDPRQPIVDFLGEWHIKAINFAGVTVEHVITGEVETYEVDYKPLKHAKASSQNGYGQGFAVDASAGAAKTASAGPASGGQAQSRPPAGSTTAIAGKVGQYMQRLSPQQRQQFMQQLQKQNASAAKKSGGNTAQQKSNGGSSSKKSSSKKSAGQSKRK
jgi:hypothetical protein